MINLVAGWQGTTLRASDLHNARATILNPFNNVHSHFREKDKDLCVRMFNLFYSAMSQAKETDLLVWEMG